MIKAVDDKCEKLKTHPDLRALLVTSLQQWMHWIAETADEKFTIHPVPTTSTPTARLINKQNAIG